MQLLYYVSLFIFCTLRKHCVYQDDTLSSSFKFIKVVKLYRMNNGFICTVQHYIPLVTASLISLLYVVRASNGTVESVKYLPEFLSNPLLY